MKVTLGRARNARLYGLSRDELRYVLDPQEVYGSDFPGETFRVLKEKELKATGSIGRGDSCWRSGMRSTDFEADKRTEADKRIAK